MVPALQVVSGKQIVIEGYTDNLPILPPLADHFPTNWNISAARAISVVRYLEPQRSIQINYPQSRSASTTQSLRMTRA